jgi:hypothetical protein
MYLDSKTTEILHWFLFPAWEVVQTWKRQGVVEGLEVMLG